MNLYWQRADGMGEAQRLTDGKNTQYPASWHPNGKFLAFEESRGPGGIDLMMLPMEGDEAFGWTPGKPTAFLSTPAAEREPMFSPDGRWLAYSSNETGRTEIYVQSFPGPGSKWQISAGGGSSPSSSPTWSHARRELFYTSADQRIMVVPYAVNGDSFRADKPRVSSQTRIAIGTDTIRSFDLHPDGDRVAIALPPETPFTRGILMKEQKLMKSFKRPSVCVRVEWRMAAATTLAFVLVALHSLALAQSAPERWIGTWSTSEVGRPQTPPPPAPAPPPFMANQCPPAPAPPPVVPPPGQTFATLPFTHFTNQTLRQIVHTSVGGSKARVVLTNAYGTAPLTIGAGYIALRDKEGTIQATSGHPLTFSGLPTITVPAGAVMYSDPVTVTVPQMADVAIDLYLPGTTNTPAPLTMHNASFQTNYVSETGNHVGKVMLPTVAKIQSWFLLSRLEVVAPDAVGAIVTFGDSITDGTRSTPDSNNRWPDQLARRMLSQSPPLKVAILNAGIAGNRVLSEGTFSNGINALARFEPNALGQPGVTHIIVLEGINDIGQARQNPTPTAEDLIAGHKQLIERAHARGLKIYGATLTPFWGAGYYTEVGEAKRQALNEWIRTGKAYDGVIDFDKATRDPNDPKKFLAAYDACDHLHLNDAGYGAMAEAIDLALFKTGQTNGPSSAKR